VYATPTKLHTLGYHWARLPRAMTSLLPPDALTRPPDAADVRRVLSKEMVDFYWLSLLRIYADVYAEWRVTCGEFETQVRGDATTEVQSGAVANRAQERISGCYALGAAPCFRTWRTERLTPKAPSDVDALVQPVEYEFVQGTKLE
jgi:hypothetical protein